MSTWGQSFSISQEVNLLDTDILSEKETMGPFLLTSVGAEGGGDMKFSLPRRQLLGSDMKCQWSSRTNTIKAPLGQSPSSSPSLPPLSSFPVGSVIKAVSSHTLSKHFTTELHPQTPFFIVRQSGWLMQIGLEPRPWALCSPGRLWTLNPPTSASWEDRITRPGSIFSLPVPTLLAMIWSMSSVTLVSV